MQEGQPWLERERTPQNISTMSAPKVDVDALRVQVKAQSERIRQMKKAGAAQEEVKAEVAVLQVLKADLEKVADQAEVTRHVSLLLTAFTSKNQLALLRFVY